MRHKLVSLALSSLAIMCVGCGKVQLLPGFFPIDLIKNFPPIKLLSDLFNLKAFLGL